MKIRSAALPAAVALALILSACTGGAPAAPVSRVDLSCDDIDSMFDIDAVVATPVAPVDPLADYAKSNLDLSYLSYSSALGALECTWSDGTSGAHAHDHDGEETHSRVHVSILPSPGSHWQSYVDYYGVTGDRQVQCNEYGCGLEQRVGDYWLSVVIDGPASPSEPALFESLATAVAALDPPAPAWQPPPGAPAFAGGCEEIVSAAELESALQLEQLTVELPHGGWSLAAAARLLAGGGACLWFTGDYQQVGGAAWLPGGEWAADKNLELSAVAPETLAVDGLADGDRAYLRCADVEAGTGGEAGTDAEAGTGGGCTVDLILGGSWLQFGLFAGEHSPPLPAGIRAAAASLADAIVTGVG